MVRAVIPERLRPSPVLAVALLGAVMALSAILPGLHANTWLFRDGRFYTNVAVTITERLSLDQGEFCASWYDGSLGWNRELDSGWSNVALGRNGEHWPKHNYLLPMAASPLVFAFGLAGTLLFNLLALGVVCAGLFRFARAFTSPPAAATAAIAFVFGSAIVGQNAYDFSTDVFLLACFSQGLAVLVEADESPRRGALAGLLFGMAVVVRPTTVAFLVPLTFLALAHAGRKPLGGAIAGGAVVLGLAGALNTYLFGAPWMTGYQRTLVVVGGHPEAASHTDLFSVPFEQGLVRLWEGEYGLRQAFSILAFALPGVIALGRRAKALTLASLLALFFSIQIFARYAYEGHRFHWAALSFFVPALAASIDLTFRLARPLARARVVLGRRGPRAALVAAIAAIALWVSELPFGLPEPRIGGGPLAGAVRDALLAAGTEDRVAAVVALVVHILVGALLVAALVRVAARFVPAEVAAGAVAVVAALPSVRAQIEAGGAPLLVHTLLVVGIERALARRRALGAISLLLGLGVALGTEDGRALFRDVVSPLAALAHAVEHEGPSRLVLPLALLALVGTGLGLLEASDRGTALAIAALTLVGLAPGLGTNDVGLRPIAALALAPASAVTLAWLAAAARTGLERGPRRVGLAASLAVLVLLLAIGGVRRVRAAEGPFHLATYEGVRHAIVLLQENGRDVPCDFLAWEHMSWECSHFDQGLDGMFGLALSGGPIEVGHVPEPLAILPTGRRGQMRRIVWPHLRAGREIVVRWAIPDGQHGGGVLRVLVNDEERARITLPATPDGWDRYERIDTAALAGSDARLEVSLAAPDGTHTPSAVGIDAAW